MEPAVGHDVVEDHVEPVRVARADEQTASVRMQPGLDDPSDLEELRRERARPVAPDEDLHRVLLDLVAHAMHVTFGNDVAVVEQDHAVRDHVDLVQDVARDDQMEPFRRKLLEQADRLGPRHRIETVQRFVEDQNRRVVRDRLCEPHALPHALAVAGDPPLGRLDQSDALERTPREAVRLASAESRNAEIGVDELVSVQPGGKESNCAQ